MQSEDFDMKVRDAAEYHHPAYDEKAWMKMEQLLNKHMPLEKDRKRRFLLILFFFLLLGGGAFLWLGTGNITGSKSAISKTSIAKNGVGNKNDNDSGKDKDRSGDINSKEQNEEDKTKDQVGQKEEEKIFRPDKNNELIQKNKKDQITERLSGNKDRTIKEKTKSVGRKEVKIKTTKDPLVKAIQPDPVKIIDNENRKNDKQLSKNNDPKIEKEWLHTKFPSIDSLNLSETNKPAITKLSHKKGSFFLAASVAPDLSIVGLKEPGKVRTSYGFGLGYTKGRITVRSGLYVARKVYSAYPEDYKAPAAFYTRYPNLQEVKADCKVYEIPLLVSYNLKKSGASPWFLNAGISSYLLKRETYDYYYKWNLSDPVVHRVRTITNANQHYFSVMTFSAGYQKALSKKISLVAEPYVKLPMTGIGFGKVKLNSAGVLISVAYKPFGSKIRK